MENTRTAGSSPNTDPRQDDTEQIHRPYVLWSAKWHACRYVGASYIETVCGIERRRDHLQGWLTHRPIEALCGRCVAITAQESR